MKIITLSIVMLMAWVSLTAAQESEPIPVLIIDGFSNHDWKQTTAVTKWILESSGRFVVDVSTVPTDSLQRDNWSLDVEPYAVIIQNTNNIHNSSLKWPEHAEKQLEAYVKNGGGLYILHSANNAFSHWKEYNKMIGLGWRPKSFGYALEISENKEIIRIPPGEGNGTGHGDRFDAVIQILNPHPINKGYPEKWMTAHTEVYSYPRGPAENLEILSFALDITDTQRLWPVEWVVSYGNGRVYNSSLGHLWSGEIYPEAYRCTGYQITVIRAAEWAATGSVTYPVPDDFPKADTKSLKSDAHFPDHLR
jgi:uncharacterized protein